MKRFLRTCLISVLLLCLVVSASALTKEEMYTAALDELAAYVSFERDNVSLESLIEQFGNLATYRSGQSFLLYVMILSEIEKADASEETDTENIAAAAPIYLNIMRVDTKFTAYLEEDMRFGSVDDLENYVMGRIAEISGDKNEAYNRYKNANAFMDSVTRITELSEELFSAQYTIAVKLLSENRYEEAYKIFKELFENGFNCETMMNTAKMLWEATVPKEHRWTEATCTAPAVCTDCGETGAPALGHDYTSATCEDPATCLRCGHKSGTKLGHQFAEATCTKAPACIRCGLTSGYRLDHDYTSATCTKPETCLNCGRTNGAALGHRFTEATCTTPETCMRCGVTAGTTSPHSYSEATCISPKTCRVCGKTEGYPLSHSWTQATCISRSTCRYCGATSGSYGNHSWIAATYTQPMTCTVCGATSGEPLKRPLSVNRFSFGARSLSPNQSIGTRTGPGNDYAPMNTYPSDLKYSGFYQTKGGSVNWAYIEFYYGGQKYRLYTGVQRFNNSSSLPYANENYTYVTVNSSVNPHYGPGYDFAECNFERIPSGARVKAFYEENDWVMVDYPLSSGKILRGWIPSDYVS